MLWRRALNKMQHVPDTEMRTAILREKISSKGVEEKSAVSAKLRSDY